MSRSTTEWVGKNDNAAIPPRVRVRIFERYHGTCQGCFRKLYPGDRWDLDHIVALCNSGEHRETNLRPMCEWCHKAKTAEDVAEKALAYRKRRAHLGLRKPRSIRSWRRFNGEKVFAPRER